MSYDVYVNCRTCGGDLKAGYETFPHGLGGMFICSEPWATIRVSR